MKTIVFIDAHVTQSLALITELENLGHKASAFSTLDDAFEQISIKTPNLIIISDSLEYHSIENFIRKLKNINNYNEIDVCVIARDSHRYQNLKVEVLTPPLHIEKLQFLLKKKKAPKPLDQDIFSEVLQDVLGEKKPSPSKKGFEEDITSKIVHFTEKEGSALTQELEHKIDILKKDSQILLQAKDKKILDLKRKIDSLELEISELSNDIKTSHETMHEWHEKSQRALKALKLAISQLEETDEDLDKLKKSA